MLKLIPPPESQFLRHLLTLDAFSVTDDAEGRRPRRRKTIIGARTSQAKYHSGSPHSQTAARDQLSCDLCEAAKGNEMCLAATVVLGVPGHDDSPDAFSLLLARDVATTLDLRLVVAKSKSPQHPVKGRYVDLRGHYRVDEDLTDDVVLIVDDVFRSGRTMLSVAAAAIEAGAEWGIGLTVSAVSP